MTLYSIFERGEPHLDPAPAVVAEKYSWFATLLPPVFMLVHGLWLELVGFVAAVMVLALLSGWLGGDVAFCLYLLLAALLGLEAPSLRRRALQRRGWTYRTELIAPAADLAQLAWLQRRGVAS